MDLILLWVVVTLIIALVIHYCKSHKEGMQGTLQRTIYRTAAEVRDYTSDYIKGIGTVHIERWCSKGQA